MINSDLPQVVDVENLSKHHQARRRLLTTSTPSGDYIKSWEINAGGFTRIEQHLFQNTANYLRRTKSFGAGVASAIFGGSGVDATGHLHHLDQLQDPTSRSPPSSGLLGSSGIMSHSMLNLASRADAIISPHAADSNG